MKKTDTRWDGGYVRNGVYVIRRSVAGVRYELSTRCTTATAAYEHLRRFEAAPQEYARQLALPQVVPQGGALFLTESLAQAFLDYSRDEKRNCDAWRDQQARFLTWWGGVLAGKDLRALDVLRDIRPALDAGRHGVGGRPKAGKETSLRPGVGCRAHRIRVLKAFVSWLRKEQGLLTAAQEALLEGLTPPPSRKAQLAKSRVITEGQIAACLADTKLQPHYKQALLIQAGTGWHVEATCKFAVAGEAVKLQRGGTVILALVTPSEKDGEPHVSEVSAEVFEAGEALLRHGSLAYHPYRKALHAACKRQGVETFNPGGFRHTVASYAVAAGATVQQVATSHGHRDARTTRRYVDLLTVPPKIPTPR